MALVFKSPQRRLLLSPASYGAPKIDWSHPLANGLIACYLPGVSRGINLVGCGGDLAPVVAANNSGSTIEGPAFKTATTNDGLKGLAPPAFLGNNNSYYWRGVF